jgi:hypothetical protein
MPAGCVVWQYGRPIMDRKAAPLATGSPHGDARTVMTESCGALARKCLFIDLLEADKAMRSWVSERDHPSTSIT